MNRKCKHQFDSGLYYCIQNHTHGPCCLLYKLHCQLHHFCCHFPTLVFDLCEIDNGGCEHNCTNIGDSYYCTCNTGYQLNSDGDGICKGK